MALDYNEWKSKSLKIRPSLESRMDYVKHVIDYEPELAPVVQYDWLNVWGRDEQVPYYFSDDWTTFAYIGGRGIGKSRTTNEWAKYLIFDKHKDHAIRIGIICPTQSDIERVMVLGESGIMSVLSPSQIGGAKYNINGAKITFDNGSVIYYYSAENAERLRGNQWHYCGLDELAAYQQDKIPDILMQVTFCLRLKPPGDPSYKCQRFISTTPKPQPWLRRLFREAMTDDSIVIARGSTYDNASNLDATIFKDIIKYEGTKLGNQEIHGELLLVNNEGIIKREWIVLWPADEPLPRIKYIFGSYDPAASEKQTNDPSAMTMFGVFVDRDGENSLIVLDNWCLRLEYPDLRAQILIDWQKKYGDRPDNKRKPSCLIVENKSNGTAILKDINRLGVRMIAYNPRAGDDKHARMNSISHLIKDGRLYMQESKINRGQPHKYFMELFDQLCDFPLVQNDDLCDTVSQALIIFNQSGLLLGDRNEEEYDSMEIAEEGAEYERKSRNPYLL